MHDFALHVFFTSQTVLYAPMTSLYVGGQSTSELRTYLSADLWDVRGRKVQSEMHSRIW